MRRHPPCRLNDVIGLVQISLVNISGRNEIVDFDSVRALKLNGVKLLFDLNVAFVSSPPALVILVHDPASLFVDHLLLQAVSCLGIDPCLSVAGEA